MLLMHLNQACLQVPTQRNERPMARNSVSSIRLTFIAD